MSLARVGGDWMVLWRIVPDVRLDGAGLNMFWARQPQIGTQTNKHADAKVVTYHNCSEQHNPGNQGIAVNKILATHTQKGEWKKQTQRGQG